MEGEARAPAVARDQTSSSSEHAHPATVPGTVTDKEAGPLPSKPAAPSEPALQVIILVCSAPFLCSLVPRPRSFLALSAALIVRVRPDIKLSAPSNLPLRRRTPCCLECIRLAYSAPILAKLGRSFGAVFQKLSPLPNSYPIMFDCC